MSSKSLLFSKYGYLDVEVYTELLMQIGQIVRQTQDIQNTTVQMLGQYGILEEHEAVCSCTLKRNAEA